MAKTQATSTRNPYDFAIGKPIYAEDAIEVVEQANWTFGYRPQTHLCLAVGDDTWATSSVGTHWLTFRATGDGLVEVLRTYIRVLPETVSITVGARCVFSGTDTGDVKFTVGGGSATLSFSVSDNGTEKKTTIATSSTGNGWLLVKVELQKQTGTDAAICRNIRIQDSPITSSLPSPVAE